MLEALRTWSHQDDILHIQSGFSSLAHQPLSVGQYFRKVRKPRPFGVWCFLYPVDLDCSLTVGLTESPAFPLQVTSKVRQGTTWAAWIALTDAQAWIKLATHETIVSARIS